MRCADASTAGARMNTEELSLSEIGVRVEHPKAKILVVLSDDELAAALHMACGMDEKKMSIPQFAKNTAKRVLELLPPLYYEPRNEK